MATRILVDAGHGGYDNGASFEGRLEKEDNLRLALKVGQDLADLGYEVYFTRDSDVYQSPTEKAQIANDAAADFFVSIHRNSSETPNQYNGVQTLIFDDSGIKAQMARNVDAQLAKIGFKDLGISVRPNLTVLKRTNMPAILVEAGFLNSDVDNALFDDNLDAIAQAIADGINETITEDTRSLMEPVYRVQVGLYQNYDNATRQQTKLQNDGYPAAIVPSGPYYAVQAGMYHTLEEAANAARNLRFLGYETLVVSSLE
jgi:N-acetylmuramoyl-L-alanine amidase